MKLTVLSLLVFFFWGGGETFFVVRMSSCFFGVRLITAQHPSRELRLSVCVCVFFTLTDTNHTQ